MLNRRCSIFKKKVLGLVTVPPESNSLLAQYYREIEAAVGNMASWPKEELEQQIGPLCSRCSQPVQLATRRSIPKKTAYLLGYSGRTGGESR